MASKQIRGARHGSQRACRSMSDVEQSGHYADVANVTRLTIAVFESAIDTLPNEPYMCGRPPRRKKNLLEDFGA
jgi:hypothetical protein